MNAAEPGDGAAEKALEEYFAVLEADPQASPAAFVAALSPEERERFQELLARSGPSVPGIPAVLDRGVVLGRYRLGEEIAQGGMGRVFRAVDTRLKRDVAIKILHSALFTAEFKERLRAESENLAHLDHPGIVKVMDVGEESGIPFLVMEWVDGKPLSAVLAELRELGRTPSAADCARAIGRPEAPGRPSLLHPTSWFVSAARILQAATRAVQAAHEKDVLHRDLKPSNVLLLGGAHPMVIDFGLSRRRGTPAGSITQGLYGGASYIAPEQLREARLGESVRTDVYQLGLLLYELLTLREAFRGDSVAEITVKIQRREFVWPRKVRPEVPRDLEAICLKAMHEDPQARYASARELGEDLDRYLHGHPVRARAPGIAHRLRLFARRHPVAVTAAAGLVLAAGAFALRSAGTPTLELHRLALRRGSTGVEREPVLPLAPGDAVGFELDSSHRVALGALCVARAPEGTPLFAEPVLLRTDAEVAAGSGPDRLFEELEGRQHRWAAVVSDAAHLDSWRVELWLLLSDRPESFEHRFFGELALLWERYGREPIPYADVEVLIELLSAAPRGALDGISAEDRRSFASALKRSFVDGTEPWSLEGQTRRVLTYDVQRKE